MGLMGWRRDVAQAVFVTHFELRVASAAIPNTKLREIRAHD